ncbi:ABC transporter permease [Hydrogenispora sp. UU3]|uniref:ABC transporter permease n=2 Tax=Capillibacterium thermochitinicola TaxID=2699427 RepID=A0A8J6LI17_9FIRM|nr:ABC transporter permease [Capillibacterium thermochitinicola]MBA2132166.1 ABC transporter permease [Capillibacterium thermochitinicola]
MTLSKMTEQIWKKLKFRESGIILALLIMCLGLTLATPSFLTAFNLGMVIRQVSFTAILALGQTLVLISGGIDLSVGAIAGLSAIVGTMMMTATGIDPYLCAFLAGLFGLFCGLLNGLLIAKIGLNPFIATLGTGEVYYGLILVLTKGYPVLGLPKKFMWLGQGMVGVVPVPVIIMILVALVVAYVLKNTPFGRYVYAIGGNEAAANLVGIKVPKIKISVYAISGFLAALSGMLYASRMAGGQPTTGQTWVMPSVTAAIIGGTSLSGGEGTILGTMVGAILMGVLTNGIVLLNISSYWERVIIGIVVILAVIIDILRNNKENSPLAFIKKIFAK